MENLKLKKSNSKIESIKLMAKFMDIEIDKNFYFKTLEHSHPLAFYIDAVNLDVKNDRTIYINEIPYTYLNFDNSWDWLMPVVEKCTDIWSDFEFDTDGRDLMEQEIWNLDNTLSEFLNNDIESIYERVVEFIRWYNKNNKNGKS